MSLYSVSQYNYTKRPDGTEVGTLKEYPIWINLELLTELSGTAPSGESAWWKVSFKDGSKFYTDLSTANYINNPEKAINPVAIQLTVYSPVNCFSYSVRQSTGEATARVISYNTYINSIAVVSIEQLDETYWKIRMADGRRYYTNVSGAEAAGKPLELIIG